MSTTNYVTPAEAGVKVGDFFYSSWGYDQTNITFFKVVALTPKGMKVQEWTNARVGGSYYDDHVVPGDGPKTGRWVGDDYDENAPYPIEQKRIQAWGEGDSRRVSAYWTTFANMYLWDGNRKSQTARGYGH